MKGVVFNLLEQVVVREYGENVWDDLLDTAGLAGTYTSLGSYPDEEIMSLVAAAAAALKLPPDEVLRWFGRRAMPLLAGHYPVFFTPLHPAPRHHVLRDERQCHHPSGGAQALCRRRLPEFSF
jgi:hypothetical protein